MIADIIQRRSIDVQVLKNHFPSCRKMFDQVADKQRSEAIYKQQKIDAERITSQQPKNIVFNFQTAGKSSAR